MQMSCYLHINLGTQRSRLSVWASAHSQLQGILSPTSADGASPPLGFACRYLPQKTNLASYFEIFRVFKVFHRVKFQPAHLDNWVCPELFVTHGQKASQAAVVSRKTEL